MIERRRFEEKRRVGILGGDVVRLPGRASFFSCGGTRETCPYCGIPLKFATAFVAVMLMAATGGAAAASAQGRMSDKDAESLMKNLTEDAKRFRSAFSSAVGKSTIRETSQEKDAKALVDGSRNRPKGC